MHATDIIGDFNTTISIIITCSIRTIIIVININIIIIFITTYTCEHCFITCTFVNKYIENLKKRRK